MIFHAIECAREAGAPDSHIILSTEDAEIAETARMTGLKVDYMRPAELATDTAGSREVIIDAMDRADKRGISYDCVVLLQPTSPLRTARDIREALALYSDEIDMVVSVTESKANPYYNLFETDAETGMLRISKGTGRFTRRQDCPKVWEYNGAIYVINPRSIREMPMGEFTKKLPYAMPAERSVDLDSPIDWLIAENLLPSIVKP